jgi:hypothetical protein
VRRVVTKQELDQAIVAWLEKNPEHDYREDVEKTQMALASPGQWEAAKVVEIDDNVVPLEHDDQG